MKSYAAILVKNNHDLLVEEINIPKLSIGQVLVRIHKTRICGSQIGEITGIKGKDRYLPHLLGHEAVGEVVDIGPGITKFKINDRVIASWIKTTGIDQIYELPTFSSKSLNKINAGPITTFSEYSIISESRLTKINDKIDSYLALLTADVLATSYGNLNYILNYNIGSNIMILGIGGIGMGSILFSILGGANNICGVDIFKNKFSELKKLGLKNYYDFEVKKNIDYNINNFKKSNSDLKFDYVIDHTGNPELMNFGLRMLKDNGILLTVGVMGKKNTLKLNTLQINYGKKIIGSKGGGIFPERDFDLIIDFLKNKKFLFKSFFNNFGKISDINSTIKKQMTGKYLNTIIEFDV